MVTTVQSIILGLVQGLTEFLPVSSSAHLVFLQSLFKWTTENVTFDVLLHFATLCAVLVYFRKDILKFLKDLRFLSLIVIGTIPTGIIAILSKDYVEQVFSEPVFSAVFLFVTALLLYFAQRYGKENKAMGNFSVWEAFFVGIIQGIAILPGISRAGATISMGMFLGWKREDSARISFILSIPAILAATLLKVKETGIGSISYIYIIGMTCALISGVFALHTLFILMRKSKLHIFSLYCIILGLIILVLKS